MLKELWSEEISSNVMREPAQGRNSKCAMNRIYSGRVLGTTRESRVKNYAFKQWWNCLGAQSSNKLSFFASKKDVWKFLLFMQLCLKFKWCRLLFLVFEKLNLSKLPTYHFLEYMDWAFFTHCPSWVPVIITMRYSTER